MGLLVLGAALHGTARIALWGAAVAIDYAGPAWLTRERLRGLQRVAVAHFAERYGLFVIICLGESIVAIGQGATAGHRQLGADEVVVVMLGLVTTVGLWWTYFDRFAQVAEDSLRTDRDPVLAAADGYSYLHLVLVAGIITFAAGRQAAGRRRRTSPRAKRVRLALCGGVGLVPARACRVQAADDRQGRLREARRRGRARDPLLRGRRARAVGARGGDHRAAGGAVRGRDGPRAAGSDCTGGRAERPRRR